MADPVVPRFELRHLLTLDAVATEGTFGRAAERLGYTQSAVSQQIAALEKAVGGTVFDRPGGPKPVRITRLGEVLLAHGRELLAKAQAAADAIDRFKAGDGRVDIGTFQTVSNVLLPTIVRRLRDEHPAADIRLFEEEIDQPRAEQLDLMFFDSPGDGDDIEQIKLLEDPHVLIARRGELPDGPVRLDQLHGAPMVALPPICDQARVEQALAARGVRPLFVFRTSDNRAVTAMVRAGLGTAVMPLLAIDLHADDTVCTHPLRPAIPPREIFLLRQRGRTLSPLAQRVIAIATEVASDVAPR